MRTIFDQELQAISGGKIIYSNRASNESFNGFNGGTNYMDIAGLNMSGAFSGIDSGNYALPIESARISQPSNWSTSVMARDCFDGAAVADKMASLSGVNKTWQTKVAAGVIGCVSYTFGRHAARLFDN